MTKENKVFFAIFLRTNVSIIYNKSETNCRYFIAHSVFLQEKMGLLHLKRSDNFEVGQIFEKL